MSDQNVNPVERVASPCVRNCCLDENDICLGCFRSITEICGWATASDAERREILARCQVRGEEMRGKKNLRARGPNHNF